MTMNQVMNYEALTQTELKRNHGAIQNLLAGHKAHVHILLPRRSTGEKNVHDHTNGPQVCL